MRPVLGWRRARKRKSHPYPTWCREGCEASRCGGQQERTAGAACNRAAPTTPNHAEQRGFWGGTPKKAPFRGPCSHPPPAPPVDESAAPGQALGGGDDVGVQGGLHGRARGQLPPPAPAGGLGVRQDPRAPAHPPGGGWSLPGGEQPHLVALHPRPGRIVQPRGRPPPSRPPPSGCPLPPASPTAPQGPLPKTPLLPEPPPLYQPFLPAPPLPPRDPFTGPVPRGSPTAPHPHQAPPSPTAPAPPCLPACLAPPPHRCGPLCAARRLELYCPRLLPSLSLPMLSPPSPPSPTRRQPGQPVARRLAAASTNQSGPCSRVRVGAAAMLAKGTGSVTEAPPPRRRRHLGSGQGGAMSGKGKKGRVRSAPSWVRAGAFICGSPS